MVKRGRKKGSMNKNASQPLTLLGYWYHVLKNPKTLEDFIKRGDERQKNEIKQALVYCKGNEPDIYEELNGKDIMRRMKWLVKNNLHMIFFNFLEAEDVTLIDKFLDVYVAKADKEEYIELYQEK